jgi:hypothetical protein
VLVASGRNLASAAVKMFSRLTYFTKTLYRVCTFIVTCKYTIMLQYIVLLAVKSLSVISTDSIQTLPKKKKHKNNII